MASESITPRCLALRIFCSSIWMLANRAFFRRSSPCAAVCSDLFCAFEDLGGVALLMSEAPEGFFFGAVTFTLAIGAE